MSTLIIIFIACLILSAFFSGNEMAYISANKIKIRERADEGDRLSQKVMDLHAQPEKFLTAILIGNNIVNVAATAVMTYALEFYVGIRSEWIVVAIMTPILLIAGEMVPKDYCRLRSESVLLKYAGALIFCMRVFYFPVKWLLHAMKWILSPLDMKDERSIFVSEKEFRSLLEQSAKEGVVDKYEKQMIDTILDFERTSAESVMIPLDRVTKIDIYSKVGEAKKLASRTKSRMILVYEEDPQIVVGLLHVFDVLFEEDDQKSLKEYLRSPIFLKSKVTIETAFLTLQQYRQSYAVVTNMESETIGVVAIEKLLVYKQS